jgi:flagellar hook-length control protein FliK
VVEAKATPGMVRLRVVGEGEAVPAASAAVPASSVASADAAPAAEPVAPAAAPKPEAKAEAKTAEKPRAAKAEAPATPAAAAEVETEEPAPAPVEPDDERAPLRARAAEAKPVTAQDTPVAEDTSADAKALRAARDAEERDAPAKREAQADRDVRRAPPAQVQAEAAAQAQTPKPAPTPTQPQPVAGAAAPAVAAVASAGTGRDAGEQTDRSLERGSDAELMRGLHIGLEPQKPAASEFAQQLAAVRSGRPNVPPPALQQVAVQIQRAAQDGQDRLTVQLRPMDLGRIDVQLEFGRDGRVRAKITAENPHTLDMLQRDAKGLEKALQDAGLKTDAGDLSFDLRGDGRQAQEESGRRSSSGRFALNDEPTPETQAAVPPPRILAPGRVDVRI